MNVLQFHGKMLNQDPISYNPSFTRILTLIFQYFLVVFHLYCV